MPTVGHAFAEDIPYPIKLSMHIFTEHIDKENILSMIDARMKIIVCIALLIMVLSYDGFLFPLMVLFLGVLLCVGLKINLKFFLLRFVEPLFIIIMVVMLKFLFTGIQPMFSVKIIGLTISGHSDGLLDGLKISVRILGAVTIISIFGFITPFTEIISGLSWFKIPKGLIEILLFAYRYIFILLEDAFVIYNSQKNRLGYITIKRGLNSFGTLVGSLIIKAFEHSHNTTSAMVQRGYDGDIPILKHKQFNSYEVICSILIIIVMGVLWKM